MRFFALALSFSLGCNSNSLNNNTVDLFPQTLDLMSAPDLLRPQHDMATPPNNPSLGAAMPQVVQLDPSSVLASPKVVVITWDNDTNRSNLESFVTNYANSTAWQAQTSEYGVGALTVGAPQHITGNAPGTLTDAMIQSLLTTNLGAAWGAPDANTIYAFGIPTGVSLDYGGTNCCTDYDGYHGDVTAGGVDVAYAVWCACPGFDGSNTNDLQQLTVVASHELVEAATDPFYTPSGFAETDDAHAVWTFITEGELADMCDEADTAYWIPSDMSYMVQRTWSNQAAAAGHDPCVGEPTVPYYQTIPDQNDIVTLDDGSNTGWSTKGIKIAMGASGTVTFHVYADASAGPFNVSVQDYEDWSGTGSKFLDITAPTTPVNPGDSFTATMNVLGKDSYFGSAEAFVVTTTPVSGGGPSTYYFGVVGQ